MPDKIDKNLVDPPIEPETESAHRVVRAALAGIPFLSGAALETFNSIIEPPMSRRKTEWMVAVTDVLNELLEKGVVTEDRLQNDEAFLTTLIHASSVAIRNHEREKLEALRNAVTNAASPGAPSETTRAIFLSFVDSWTTWHFTLMRFFQSPTVWIRMRGVNFPDFKQAEWGSVIEAAIPEFHGQADIYMPIWEEVFSRRFVRVGPLAAPATSAKLQESLTTDVGNQFLAFITARD